MEIHTHTHTHTHIHMILPFLAQIPFISSLENVGVHGCSEAEAGTTYISHISSVQFSSVTYDSATPWTATHQASLSITNSRSLLKLMSITLVMPSNHSSSVIPFSSCLQSFPASGFSQMSEFFTSCGQSIGASASASVLPLGWTGWISLQSKGLSSLLQHHSSKA